MEFKASQQDMNTAYFSGATGILVSGLVWCIAGVVGVMVSNVASMIALFVGGTLIFPLSVVLSKTLKRSGKHSPENALRHLALEGLGVLFGGLFIAFSVAQVHMAFFYPIMLLVIGARYLTFQTLYGLKVYWVLGAVLMLAGMLTLVLGAPFIAGAFIGGIIEVVFAVVVFRLNKSVEPVADSR